MKTIDQTSQSWELLYKRLGKQRAGQERSDFINNLIVEDIIKKLVLNGQQKLLEVGCGECHIAKKIKSSTTSIIATDFSHEIVSLIQQSNLGIEIKWAEASKLPFRDKSFDRVLCYDVVHYFPDLDYTHKAIKEMIRVCKKGGIILIGDIPNKKKRFNFYFPKHKIKILTPLKIIKFWFSLAKLFIQRLSEGKIKTKLLFDWLWYDLNSLSEFINLLGYESKILDPPQQLFTSAFRNDILIFK